MHHAGRGASGMLSPGADEQECSTPSPRGSDASMRDDDDDQSKALGSPGSNAGGSGPNLDGMRDALDPPPEVVDLLVRSKSRCQVICRS